MTLRTTLRAATRQDHDRVDQLGGAFDLTRSKDYQAFLQAHAAVLPGIEQALDAAPAEHLPPAWPQRRRAPALAADLAALGLASPPAASTVDLPDRATRLGALYVLEGSRLGGAILRRRLAEAQPTAPDAYLAHGQGLSLWRSFVEWLDEKSLDASQTEAAVHGARQVFGAFETAFRDATTPAP
ncbi:MAG: biliverdin-producing heme oxygenase [Phenylobacterium sp.]|uniref:biliverdin-producing heme oxygenase n=1 Tax=Phenylobacterium sp. TaxID=1871053 RepID=UPI00271BD18E|nr:biliverdin-producing heme oxygenase [Phenylobacterium sp.]MDO8901848.1 biliverdin-producing heme oxygenase [Phenylobacterium sp.]MDP2213169.1 biliverdin-producing heme oxygenase [Phenylobacterium sp.]